ncbi:hypothetical protein FGO68_gene4612 [Halteria grandinella]|uniref:Uncharacterized protein n=1 Tax=Halteria grandinella TaxID=5974 RepID=A0A8J8NWT1_HALGN|nr:hypothetical protein FGO68_gene4612 [Halteria grandinella]
MQFEETQVDQQPSTPQTILFCLVPIFKRFSLMFKFGALLQSSCLSSLINSDLFIQIIKTEETQAYGHSYGQQLAFTKQHRYYLLKTFQNAQHLCSFLYTFTICQEYHYFNYHS